METHEKNLILYGPPGTGKTYSVIDEALKIIDSEKYADIIGKPEKRAEAQAAFRKLCDNTRIRFCTFHQSFGYEEFVEGLRSGETAGLFHVESGIFKSLCDAARAREQKPAAKYDFAEGTRFFKMSLGNSMLPEDQDIYQYCLANNVIALGWGEDVDFTSHKTIEEIRTAWDSSYPDLSPFGADAVLRFKEWMRPGDIVFISNGNKMARAVAKIVGDYRYEPSPPIPFHQFRSVEWLLKDANIPVDQILRGKKFSQPAIYQLNDKDLMLDNIRALLQGPTKAEETANFVLVIDEINRGNISKIFGELITLIEPDKRLGAENEIQVTLPYSNETFSVPQNVYIIGTMNTADRSIALLDTALRRRFSFRELMPRYDLLSEDVEGLDVREMLQTMNDRIEYLYDRDHVIGHAFFIGKNSIAQVGEVMMRCVIPLLQEYFYEDWEKIAMVLGGAGKTASEGTAGYLLWQEKLEPAKLFKNGHHLNDAEAKVCYKVVEQPTLEALKRIYQD